MRVRAPLVLVFIFLTATANAQEARWRIVSPASGAPAAQKAITLGRPIPMDSSVQGAAYTQDSASPYIARAQGPDGPPPGFVPPPPSPGPPGGLAPGFIPAAPGEEAYNCGVPTTKPPAKGIFEGFWDRIRGMPKDMGAPIATVFEPAVAKGLFQSDHEFDNFVSPMTAPFIFEDPRALTEFRPVFLWQHTRDSNPLFRGGDNFFLAFQGRVAFTNWFSITMPRLGFTWTEPEGGGAGIRPAFSFSEFWIGPKFTLLRNADTGTLGALGLTFQVPTGPSRTFQDTGSLSLDPYFSVAQNFWKTSYGSINVMNTTGWALSTDRKRTNWIHTSFHADYDIGNLHRFYPLVELHYMHYTRNGNSRTLSFEGADLFNFGANGVGGRDELRVASGFRYQHNPNLGFGIAAEIGLLGGGNHLDGFRLTTDMILRY